MKTLLLIGAGSIFLIGGLLTMGCGGPPRLHCFGSPEKKADWMIKKITKELKLNDGQKTTLFTIKEDLIAKHREMKPDQTKMHAEIKSLLLSEKLEPAQVNALVEKKQVQHTQMKTYLISKFVEFHAILTAEQKQLLVNKLESFHKHIGKWHDSK